MFSLECSRVALKCIISIVICCIITFSMSYSITILGVLQMLKKLHLHTMLFVIDNARNLIEAKQTFKNE